MIYLFTVTIICDPEYPKRVAYDLIYKILEEFNLNYVSNIKLETINKDLDINFAYIDKIIETWQNPVERIIHHLLRG
jgi:hypothetical protein